MSTDPRDAWKDRAARAAVERVEDGMVLGLGTGSTADFALAALARRVQAGLRVVGIPTSERTAARARDLGIPLAGFAEHRRLDLTIDGADEIARGSLDLIKGLGGALLREKIVAAASRRMIVIADHAKLVDRLGSRSPLPVEIVAFGWQATCDRLAALGVAPHLRLGADGTPVPTDGGNVIADCAIGPTEEPAALEARLKAVVGVVETGLFVGLASEAIVAGPDGVEVLTRSSGGNPAG